MAEQRAQAKIQTGNPLSEGRELEWVGINGSRLKSIMNRLQYQVKKLDFIAEIISKFYTLK